MGGNSHTYSYPCYLTVNLRLNRNKGKRDFSRRAGLLVLTWNTTRDFSSRYWEMDVPTTTPLSITQQQILLEASDRFSVDPFLWGFSRGSCCWETRVWPDQLGVNFEAFRHRCFVSDYCRESSYETRGFKFGFWTASRIQRNLDVNDPHRICPENSPGDMPHPFPSAISDCCCITTPPSDLTHTCQADSLWGQGPPFCFVV